MVCRERRLLVILVLVAWCTTAVTSTFASDGNDEDNALLPDPESEEDFGEEDSNTFDTDTDPPLKCPTFCKRTSRSRQWFEPGRRYEYAYHASASVALPATTEHGVPRLILRATVHLDALNECQMRLNVSAASLELEGASASSGERRRRRPARASPLEDDLMRRPLVFSFADGRIDALCPAADESLFALNVKRGLLSALQSSGDSVGSRNRVVYERDINGMCPTKYEWMPYGEEEKEDMYFLFRERSCGQQSEAHIPLPSGTPSSVDVSPIEKIVKCRQRFAENILREVHCSEFQFLGLFSDSDSSEGPLVQAPMTLEFKGMVNLTQDNDIDSSAPSGPRTTLQFEAEPVAEEEETRAVSGDATDALAIVQQLAALTEDPAAPQKDEDAAALLRRLSIALRRSDFAALQKLFGQVENQPASRRLVLEVLPSARTQAAAALVTRLAAERRLKPEEVDAWLATRALRVAPSDHELLALTPLVETWSARPRVLLAAGALVFSRCSAAAGGAMIACSRGSPAAALVSMLERPLGPRCHQAAADEDGTFAALRALGNAGFFSKRVYSKITHCYQNPQNPLPLRLAAVDALRRSPCADIDTQPLLRLFSSRRSDTELRIASYLTTFRCASAATVRAAREVLRTEDLGQVTSFVWSHLSNIMKSPLTWKTDISHFMEDDFLRNKFSVESLKYSRNYRSSLGNNLHTTEVESNVIFSRDSYFPRSASVNLTVQLFRQPINLLEIGGRMEGFERTLEDFFGPKGYYPEAALHKMLTSLKGKRDVEMEQSLQRMRTAFGAATDKRLHPEPRADVFARVFGQEVAFTSLHNTPQVMNNLREGDPVTAALRSLFSAGTLDITKAMMLDEAKYTFPTIVGLPVSLSLGASALLRVRAQGNWSSSDAAGAPWGSKLRAEAALSPSAALAVDAAMLVGPVAGPRVGVRLRQRARVASHAGAAVEFQGLRLARLELRAPTRTLQLLDASSTLLLVEDGEEQAMRLESHVSQRNESMCSGSTLERVLGVRACANVLYSSNASLDFLLSGPAAVHLELSKTDDFDRYETRWELEANENGARGLKVSFDTPGSSVDRAVHVEARADADGGPSFRLRVRSPAGGAEASASVARNESAASAAARLAVDGSELLRVAAALHWERPEHGPDALRLRPELDARAAGGAPLRLAGELGLVPGARYHAHVVLRGSGEPVKLQGELRLRDSSYEVLGEVSCPLLNGSLSGNVTAEPGLCASDLRVEYETADGHRHTAAWSHSYEAGASSLALNASTELSEFPAASAALQWALRREPSLWEHRLRWERAQNVWKAIQRLRTQRRGPRTHLHALAALACPQRRIDYKLDLEHQVDEGNSSTRGEVLLGWKQRYAGAVHFSRAPGPRVELNAEASTPSVRAEVHGRVAKKKHLHGELEGVLITPRGRSNLALTGTYKQEGGSAVAFPPGAQAHQLQLQLTGALRGEMQAHVSLGPDGVDHALRLKTGTVSSDAPPSYAHFLNYKSYEGRHLIDAIISVGDQNFTGSVEAIQNDEDESVVVRLPFSSQIILSTKWHGSKNDSEEFDQEYFDVEISWDKHLFPNNYVSFNSTKNGSYSRRVLDYPNQNIFGEVVNEPGYLSLDMRWDKQNENRKIQSKANWNFEPNEGRVTAWVHTPFKYLAEQSIDMSYSSNAEDLKLQVSAKAVEEELLWNSSWHRDSSGGVKASLDANCTLTPPLKVVFEHEPRVRTFISATGGIAIAQMNISRSASDGSISALSARSRLWPYAECSLDAAHADGERRGALECGAALALSFRAADRRPSASFEGYLQRFGTARFNFNFVGKNKTAIFETRSPIWADPPFFFSVSMEHYQQSRDNFTLKTFTAWKERGFVSVVEASRGAQQTKFHGSMSGDLVLEVTFVRNHSSQYPHDFFTLISLPDEIRLNHTFKGTNPMNWMGEMHVTTRYREGLLKLEQAWDPSRFYHHAVAETTLKRRGTYGNSEEGRRVEALLSVDREDAAPFGVKQVLASLSPPRASEPLSLNWTYTPDEQVLAMKHPLHALALRVLHSTDADDAYYINGTLDIPGAAPLEVKTVLKINQDIFVDMKGQWGNQSFAIESMVFMVSGTETCYFHAEHSSYGEILHVDYTRKATGGGSIVRGGARYFGREVHVTLEEKMRQMFEEWKLNLTSPYPEWRTASAVIRVDSEAALTEMSFTARRNEEEMGILLKSDLPRKNSVLKMDYGLVRMWFRGDYANAVVDRRVKKNQKMGGELFFGGKMAEFQGAVTSRRTGGSIRGLLKTWLTGLQHTEMLVNFTNTDLHELEIFLKQDEWVLQVDGISKFGHERSFASLNVILPPTSPVRNITGKLNYHKQSPNDHQLVMSAVCDGQVLETNVSLAASDGEVAAFLDTRNSLLGYGPLTARFNLAGTLATNKTLLFELSAGQGHVNLSGWLSTPSILRFDGHLDAKYGTLNQLLADLRYDMSGVEEGRRHALLRVRLPDGEEHSLSAEALSSDGCRCVNASATLASPAVGRLRVGAAFDGKEVGAVYANAEVVAGSGDEERRFLDVALSLRDSILSAQMVAEPLGLRVLSVTSGWAEREPRRYARLHVHVAGLRELRAEASAHHDLRACEVLLLLSADAASEEMTTRLHAKYQEEGQQRWRRNVTAVWVHARDARTLTASLERQGGDEGDTHAEVYAAASSSGRMHVVADVRKDKGSTLELFVDDNNLDPILHSRASLERKKVDFFIESWHADFRKLNFSLEMDLTPTFNYTSFYLEHVAGTSYLPSVVAARIDTSGLLFRLDNNYLTENPNLRNMELKILYEKLVKSPTSPSYELVLSLNRTEVLRSLTKLVLSREKMKVNTKINTNFLGEKWKMGVELKYEKVNPYSVEIKVVDQTGTLLEFGGSCEEGSDDDDFSVRASLTSHYGRRSHVAELKYRSHPSVSLAFDANSTLDGETSEYYGGLLYDPSHALELRVARTNGGRLDASDSLDLHLRRDDDGLELGVRAEFPSVASARLLLRGVQGGSVNDTDTPGKYSATPLKDLVNASLIVEVSRSDGKSWKVSGSYDIRDSKRTVSALLPSTDDNLIKIDAHWDAQLSPTQSGKNDGISPYIDTRLTAHTILRNELLKKVVDFQMQFHDWETSPSLLVSFSSSFIKDPLSVAYNYSTFTDSYRNETKISVDFNAFGEALNIFLRSYSDKSQIEYNMESSLFDKTGNFEILIRKQEIRGKIKLEESHGELLLTTVRSNTSMLGDGFFTFSVREGKSFFWKTYYDFRGKQKHFETFIEKLGEKIINGQVFVKIDGENRLEEISADAIAPIAKLNRATFEYTWKNHDRSTYDGEHVVNVLWKTVKQETHAHLNFDVSGLNKTLNISVTKDQDDILSVLSNSLHSSDQNVETKHGNAILNYMGSKWLLSRTFKWKKNIPLRASIEIVTPLKELHHLIFTASLESGFSMDLNTTIDNKKSSLALKYNKLSVSGKFISTHQPNLHVDVKGKFDNSSTTGYISSFVEYGERNILVEGQVTLKEQEVNMQLYFEPSWMENFTISAENVDSESRVTILVGREVWTSGKMTHKISPHVHIDMGLVANIRKKHMQISAAYYSEKDEGPLRTGNFEWLTSDSIVKGDFKLNDPDDDGYPELEASFNWTLNEPIVLSTFKGVWPKSCDLRMLLGKESKEYNILYTLDEYTDSAQSKLSIRTPFAEPLELSLAFEKDAITMQRKVTVNAQGYGANISWNLSNRKELVVDIEMPNRKNIFAKVSYVNQKIDLHASWPNGDPTATLIFILDLSLDGSLIITTPWAMDLKAGWKGGLRPTGEIDASGLAPFDEYSAFLDAKSPWYSVTMKGTKINDKDLSFTGTVMKENYRSPVVNCLFESGPVTQLRVEVWDSIYHAAVRENGFKKIYVLAANQFLKIETNASFTPSGALLDAHLISNRSQNQVEATWKSSDGTFKLNADLKSFRTYLWVDADLEDIVIFVNYTSPSLKLKTEVDPEKTLFWANVDYESSRLEIQRLERSVRFLGQLDVAGSRLSAQASANWRPGEIHLEAAAGEWKADLTASKNPPRLHGNWRNSSLEVQPERVRMVTMDGAEHSLLWTAERNDGRARARVQVDSPALSPEHMALELKLDLGRKLKAEHLVKVRALLERGRQRHSVELNIFPDTLSTMQLTAKADERVALSVGYSYQRTRIAENASMHFTLWDQESYLKVTRNTSFPFESSVSARSPWLLRGERVLARVVPDVRSLHAAVEVGEASRRRDAVLDVRLGDASATLGFRSAFHATAVRDFALNAALRGSLLEDADGAASATVETRLVTADGASLSGSAVAGLSALFLWANTTFVSENQSTKSPYSMGFWIPLSLRENTTLSAWLSDPHSNYTFNADLQKTDVSVSTHVSVHTPDFSGSASLQTRRQPFTLTAAASSTARGFERYAVRVNTPADANDAATRVYAFEWGAGASRRAELRHRFLLGDASVAAAVELHTPFRGLERCALHVAYENGARKLAMARVHYPGLDRDLGLELDYCVGGLTNASVRVAFHAPSNIPAFVPRLRSAELELVHVLERGDRADAFAYRFELRGEVNGRRADAALAVDAAAAPGSIQVLFGATQDNEDILRLTAKAQSPDRHERQMYSVEVHSRAEYLRHFHIFLDLSPLRVNILVRRNDVRYIDFAETRDLDGGYHLVFVNPLKSMSVSVTKQLLRLHLKLALEVGWERDGVLEPVVGGGVARAVGADRVECSAWAFASGWAVRGEGAWEESATAWERKAYVAWDGGKKALGFQVAAARGGKGGAWERHAEAQVGERAVLLLARGSTRAQSAELLWDAKRDPTKRAAVALSLGTADGLELKLEHPLLGDGARLAVNAHLETEDRELRAGATIVLALLMQHGVHWRASAAMQVVPRTSDTQGRAVVSLRLEDRIEGRDMSVELTARMGQEEALQIPKGEAMAFALNVTYLTGRSAAWRTLLSEVRASPRLLLLHTLTPEAEVTLRARSWDLGAEVLARADRQDAVRLLVVAEPETRSMSGELQLSGRDHFRLRMSAPHRRLLVAEVLHMVPDAGLRPLLLAKASLPAPRLFQAKADWATTIGWSDAMDAVQLMRDEVERVPSAARAAADAHARLWQQQWDAKIPWPTGGEWRDFKREEAGAIADDLKGTMAALYETKVALGVSVQGVMDMALDNAGGSAHALWEDVCNFSNAVVQSLLQWGSAVTTALAECLQVVLDAVDSDILQSALRDALTRFRTQILLARTAVLERAAGLLDSIGNGLEDWSKMTVEWADMVDLKLVGPLTRYTWRSVEAIADAYFQFASRVQELSTDIILGFMDVEEINKLMEMSDEAMQWLKGPFNDYLEKFANYVLEVVELVLCDLEQSLRLLWEKMQRMTPNLPSAVRDLYHQLFAFWNSSGAAILLAKLEEWRTMTELASERHTFNFDPKGHLLVRQHLPVDWDGFDRFPRFDQLRRQILFKDDDGADAGLSIRDDVIDMMNDWTSQTPRSLLERALSHTLPTFSGTAQLVGTSHVITFDGNAYAVDGDCSYLLSGDLVHNTFAIVVHFSPQAPNERSFTILTPVDHITVNKDYVVRVGGSVVDLPWRHFDYLDVRRSEDALEVTAPGVRFRCNVRSDVCTVHVSGWNFGHVAGLLGSFDRERADDLDAVPGMQADGGSGGGHRVWRMGRCWASNRSPSESINMAGYTVTPACKQMFEEPPSVLSMCHSAVDPSPYIALCSALGPCRASQAYSEACRLKTSVKIKVPLECGSCVGPDGDHLSAGGVAPSAGPQADVALVVQRACGRRGGLQQRVSDVASHVAAALAQRGVQNARFAVVAFGGGDAGVQLQAPAGRVWTEDVKALQRMIIRLQQESVGVGGGGAVAAASAGEAEAAVVAASALRPRAGAGRAVVLVQCGVCGRDAFAQLAAPLESAGGAPLHVLRPGALSGASAGAKATRALGVSGKGLAFGTPTPPQRTNAHTPEALLAEKAIAQALVAKDGCTAAALESGGSVFDPSRATGAAGQPSAKRFMDAWVEEVTRSIRPSTCSRFRCTAEGQTLCAAQEISPQNSEEADEQFMQFLQ